MLVFLFLAASHQGVVIGVGSRASTIIVSKMDPVKAGLLADGAEIVMLTDVIGPMVGQRRAVAGTRWTVDLLLGEIVTIEPRKVDDQLRALGEDDGVSVHGRVRLGNLWLHEALLKEGHAWVAPAAQKDGTLVKLEADARAAKRGLWADADPVEPWLWKDVVLLRDEDNKRVHAGWECPWVQETQCKTCRGGFDSLAAARAAGFTLHDACMTKDAQRIAEARGDVVEVDDDGRVELPPSPRRECKVDAECALAPVVPCTCGGCGGQWRQAARKEIVKRMTKNFARATCMPPGCPACAGHLVGTKAVCKAQQCSVE